MTTKTIRNRKEKKEKKGKSLFYVVLLSLFFYSSVVFSVQPHAIEKRALSDDEILIKETDNVQDKLDSAAETINTLVFDVGTYELNLNISRTINLRGISTSHVILKSDGLNPIISVSDGASLTVQNFTFSEADLGLSALSSTVILKNNIFNVDTAIEMDVNSLVTVENNTFHNVGTAVEVTEPDKEVTIRNNIFSELTDTSRLLINVLDGSISSNCFDEVISISSLPLSKYEADLGFADLENEDFHLTESSVCKDSASSADDMGAFGGEDADEYAYPVSGITTTAVDLTDVTDTGVTVSWLENKDYRVDGYKIYYSRESMSNFDFETDRSTLAVKTVAIGETASDTSLLIDDLEASGNVPDVPVLISVLPVSSGKLIVKWNSATDATGYTVFYQLDGDTEKSQYAGNVNKYTLTGLTNGKNYTVWLVAHNHYRYYFQVVPYINTTVDNTETTIEGLFINDDTVYSRTDKDLKSASSGSIGAIPEAVVPYPALPNEGCFIATAAFGYYSHSQVQILRDFRDNYLLNNEYGSAFVTWYYRYGPHAAAYINDYDILKPIVRVALYPLIILAEVLSYSVVMFWCLVSLISIVSGFTLYFVIFAVRKKFQQRSRFLFYLRSCVKGQSVC